MWLDLQSPFVCPSFQFAPAQLPPVGLPYQLPAFPARSGTDTARQLDHARKGVESGHLLWLDQTAQVEWNQGTLFGFLRQSGSFALGQLGKMGQDCVLPLFVFFGLLAYLSVNLGWENLGHWGWFQDNVCRCSGLGQLSCGLPFDACKECLHPVGGDWLVSACLGWGAAAVVTVLCAF